MKIIKFVVVCSLSVVLSACILKGDPLEDSAENSSGSSGQGSSSIKSDFHDFSFASFTPAQLQQLFQAKTQGDVDAARRIIPNAPGTGRHLIIPNDPKDNNSQTDLTASEVIWDNNNKQWGSSQDVGTERDIPRQYVKLESSGWSNPINSSTRISYRSDGNRIIESALGVSRSWGIDFTLGTKPLSISAYNNFWAYWAQLQFFNETEARQYDVRKTTDKDYYYLMQLGSLINGQPQYNFVPIAAIPGAAATLNYGGNVENIIVALEFNPDGTPKPSGGAAFLNPTNLSSIIGSLSSYKEETIEPSGEKIYRIIIPTDDTEIRQALFLPGWQDLFFARTTKINDSGTPAYYFGIHFKKGLNKNPDGSPIIYHYLNDKAAEEIESKFNTYCNSGTNCQH